MMGFYFAQGIVAILLFAVVFGFLFVVSAVLSLFKGGKK